MQLFKGGVDATQIVDVSISRAEIGRYWLECCVRNHSCGNIGGSSNAKSPDPALPTRVIYVGTESSKSDPFLILSQSKRDRYTTLSYVWGFGQHFTTTHDTFESYRKVIPLKSLPRTFQDAIQVTRELGIMYLWIDALCIIQDSPEDLQRELGNMSQTYSNSTVTLAASGSDGVNDGMITARNLIGFVPCQLAPELHVRDYRMNASSPNFPLNRRAWCLQETVLSSRVIWFGTEELFWSCRKCQRRESLWDEDWSMREDDLSQGIMSIFEPEPLLIDFIASSERNAKLAAWYDIVSMYSGRQLTKQSDKLAALTGLATLFGSILEDDTGSSAPASTNASQYLAGLWRIDVLRGLLWTNNAPQKFPSHRVPTWTWSAMDAQISYTSSVVENQDLRFCTELIEVNVSAASTLNPYGDVLSDGLKNKIILEGPAAPIFLDVEVHGFNSVKSVTFTTVKDGFVAVNDPRLSFYVDVNYLDLIDEYCILLRVADEHCLILTSTARPLNNTRANVTNSTARITMAADFLQSNEAFRPPFNTFLRVGYLAFDLPQSALSGGSSRLGKHARMLDEVLWKVRRVVII